MHMPQCFAALIRSVRALGSGSLYHPSLAAIARSRQYPVLLQTGRVSAKTIQDQNAKVPLSPTTIYKVSQSELVTKQRLNRPVSPSLSIYSWEIMICGALHRNTAILLSGSMYLFGFSYFALPFLGVPFGSAELVAWFGELPIAVKVLIKWIYGFSLSFHFAHGLRHLIWDTGVMLANAQVKRTVVVALAIGAVGATGLCCI